MPDATCKTCPFSHPHPNQGGLQCRLAPRPTGEHGFPGMLDTEWCSSHPLRQRDRLAAMAMQGLCAVDKNPDAAWLAPTAYAIADAMLAERIHSPTTTEKP